MYRSDADRLRAVTWDALSNAQHAEDMALAACPVQHHAHADDFSDVQELCESTEPGGIAHRAAMCAARSARAASCLAQAVYTDTVAEGIRAAAAAPVTAEGTYDVAGLAARTRSRRAQLAADALIPTRGWNI